MAMAFTQRHRDLHNKTREQEGYHGDKCERTYLKAMKALQFFHAVEDLLRKTKDQRVRKELRIELRIARAKLDKLKSKYRVEYNEWWRGAERRKEVEEARWSRNTQDLALAALEFRAGSKFVNPQHLNSHLQVCDWLDELLNIRLNNAKGVK